MRQEIMIRHRVANFETWQTAFSEHAPARKESGIEGHRVVRDPSDPNLLTCILSVSNLERAKEMLSSPELHRTMAAAGVQGTPEISFCEVIEERRY
jgi:hypothetical protein